MNPLPVQRFQFNCRVQTPLKLNFYSGSLLRGSFGHALRKLVCTTRMSNCKACMLYRHCLYPQVFETPPLPGKSFQDFSQIPNPFVIEPPPMGQQVLRTGDTFSFALVLIGNTLQQLPILIYAWQQALVNGLGPQQARVELLDVVLEPGRPEARTIYTAGPDARVQDYPVFAPATAPAAERIVLHLKTPLRIQQKGKVLSATMTGKDFILALVRRYYLLKEFHGSNYQAPDFQQLAEQAGQVSGQPCFHWCEWQRYSSRQQQKMIFGGVLGELELSGNLAPFMPLLVLGQWLHVGNKTTFGMGCYEIM